MSLILQSRIYRADLKANPTILYVFGDNEERVGYGGQAGEMRGEPNAIGVATLASPAKYWTADDTARQCKVIDQDLAPAFDALRSGRLVVFPLDGIGTGIAALSIHAPDTFDHLLRRIEELKRAGAT